MYSKSLVIANTLALSYCSTRCTKRILSVGEQMKTREKEAFEVFRNPKRKEITEQMDSRSKLQSFFLIGAANGCAKHQVFLDKERVIRFHLSSLSNTRGAPCCTGECLIPCVPVNGACPLPPLSLPILFISLAHSLPNLHRYGLHALPPSLTLIKPKKEPPIGGAWPLYPLCSNTGRESTRILIHMCAWIYVLPPLLPMHIRELLLPPPGSLVWLWLLWLLVLLSFLNVCTTGFHWFVSAVA
jgi:hypothetical protein